MPAQPPPRLTDTASGKTILGLLIAAFLLLLTSATDGRWYSLLLPALPMSAAMLVFIAALIRGLRIPRLNKLAWITLAGAGYFLLRAWLSRSLYDSWTDMALILTGCVFYVLGSFCGLSEKRDRTLFLCAASLLMLNLAVLLLQRITETPFTVLRPSISLTLDYVTNTGLFGYKNFTGHFMVAGGFFCCGYFMIKGRDAWKWLMIGLLSIAGSYWCDSRAILPNIAFGVLACWIIYLCKIYRQTTKFYLVGGIGMFLLILAVGGLMLMMSQNAAMLDSLSQIWHSGGRYNLTGIAVELAKQAPLFGHGSLAFENGAIPYFDAPSIPNMAHNEYAQSMADYGFTGFAILLALIVVHLIRGVRQILRSTGDHSRYTARLAASTLLLSVASMHATMDFIWHNGALVAMGAFCAGMIATGLPSGQKAGRGVNNTALGLAAALTAGFFAWVAYQAWPVWERGWKLSSLPKADNAARIELLKEVISLSGDPEITNKYASLVASIQTQRGLVPAHELEFTEQALRNALLHSPDNRFSATYLGIILSMEERFDEADKILEPFTREGAYYDWLFNWQTAYVFHLVSWAETILQDDPSTALSILKEAGNRINRIGYYQSFDSGIRANLKNRLALEILMLEDAGIKPDESWKKEHPAQNDAARDS